MKVFFIGVVLYTAYIALPAHAAIVVNGSMTDVGGDYNTVNGIVPAESGSSRCGRLYERNLLKRPHWLCCTYPNPHSGALRVIGV